MDKTPVATTPAHTGISQASRELADNQGITVAAAVERLKREETLKAKETTKDSVPNDID